MEQEDMRETKMSEITETDSCARGGDLVAFLYREANEIEARDFQLHLNVCSDCRTELAAFGGVREGIGAWRSEALGTVPVMATEREVFEISKKRSAIAAIREFFTLSPIWLRGATAFATVLLVALLVVTGLRFFDRPETSASKQFPSVTPGSEGNLQMPKDGVVEAKQISPTPAPPIETADNPPQKSKDRVIHAASRPNSNRRGTKPVLSNEERSQLNDLLIAERDDEESIPRLYDLLLESN